MAIVLSGTTGIDAGSLPVANTGKISAGAGLSAILNTAGVDRVTVDTSGNVGIGTNSPTTKMHIVDGNLRVESSSASPTIQLTDTGVANSYIYMPKGSNALAYNVGGAERMRIDSSGRVTMPYQPAFSAYGVSNIGSSTDQVYPTVRFNIGGHYNTSNGRFTAPVSGTYLFGWTQIGGVSDTVWRYMIKKNGTTIGDVHLRLDTTASGSNYGTNGMYTYPVYLNANEYVNIYFASDNGTTQHPGSANALDDYPQFWGYLIG